MEIKYFKDTDTLLVIFNHNKIEETKDLNENMLAEFDRTGRIVSVTIEHAKSQTNIASFSFQQIDELPETELKELIA